MRIRLLLVGLAFGLLPAPASATSEESLRAAIEKRFKGDRTGACVAAAVIDNTVTARAYVCADDRTARQIDDHTAFEIGSVSKTMTGALLAEFIMRGEIALDDPLSKLLPKGTVVPSYEGAPITIRHIVSHTSGLPSFPWRMAGPQNPYARLTEADLLGTLATTQLKRAPGSQWEYSNFAFMVLSFALARRSGMDFETLLRERLLAPLGMNDTYVAKPPPGVRAAQGHLANAIPAGPWDFHVDMSGVGGVRATLPDMVRYLEGQLGMRDSAITSALAHTQQQVAVIGAHTQGIAWGLLTNASLANGHPLVMHAGGTGAFSAFAAFDRTAMRAAILLSDTALTDIGGLRSLALHLLDPAQPPGEPRTIAKADATLIDALVGRFRLKNGLAMDVRRKGDILTIQADGQPEFEMAYDSAGDFFPLKFDAVLRPNRKADGTYAFTWLQLGGVLPAERISPPPPPRVAWAPAASEIKDYEGIYPLLPTLALHVSTQGTQLVAQGTGQASIALAPIEKDLFVAEAVGAEVRFERDAGGRVIALTLKQNGRLLRGERR